MTKSSLFYNISQPAKSLTSVYSENERQLFLVGTCDIQQDNEIHLIDYDEDEHRFYSSIFDHPNEVISIASSNHNLKLIATCSSLATSTLKEENSADLFLLSECDPKGSQDNTSELKPLGKLTSKNDPHAVIFSPFDANIVVTLHKSNAILYSIKQGIDTIKNNNVSGEWKKTIFHPSKENELLISHQNSISMIDIRSQVFSLSLSSQFKEIRDFDVNPMRSNYIATCSANAVEIWDVRNSKTSVETLNHHTHWICSVSFNKFHDMLLLTSGTDGLVNLENLFTYSSASLYVTQDDPDFQNFQKPTNGLVKSYDQLEDSCYGVSWSAVDPWIFAALSYDGRFVIDHVPKEEKYKIIL
ncbi:WD40 repeat-like protein [Rozella allomycis CSF55]|uniref:WD40 repeat-like protein n=1 Tax=Rozella allomycis (strain CSF55) TaxID=988480 RepID=A0A4P9YED3_ROZAC|nr:WD40 repeat-like protein [Rozella allomycis CSF55]